MSSCGCVKMKFSSNCDTQRNRDEQFLNFDVESSYQPDWHSDILARTTRALSSMTIDSADQDLGSNDSDKQPIKRYDVDIVDGIEIFQFLTEEDLEFHANHEPLPSREEQEFLGFDVRNQLSRALLDSYNSQVKNSDKVIIPVCRNRAGRNTGFPPANTMNSAAQDVGSNDNNKQQPIDKRCDVDIVDGIEIFQFLTEADMEFHANHEPLPYREEQEFLGFDVGNQPSSVLVDAFNSLVKNSRHEKLIIPICKDRATRITEPLSAKTSNSAAQDRDSQETVACRDQQEFLGDDVQNEPSSVPMGLPTSKVKEYSLASEKVPNSEPADTAQPEPSDTAQPEPSDTAQPEPSDTAQPEPSGTAQPELSDTAQPEPPTIIISASDDEDCVIVSVTSAPKETCLNCGKCVKRHFPSSTEIISLDSDEGNVNTCIPNLKYGLPKNNHINCNNIVRREDSANTSICSFKQGCSKSNKQTTTTIETNYNCKDKDPEEDNASTTTSKISTYNANTNLVCSNTGDVYFNKRNPEGETSYTTRENGYSNENVDINYNNSVPEKDPANISSSNVVHGCPNSDKINYQINNNTLINDSEKQDEHLDESPTLIITDYRSLALDHNYVVTQEKHFVFYNAPGCAVSFSEGRSDLSPSPSSAVAGDVVYINDEDTSLLCPSKVGSSTHCDTVSNQSNHTLKGSEPNPIMHNHKNVGSAGSELKRCEETLKSDFSSENLSVVNRNTLNSTSTVDEIICLDSDDDTNHEEPKQLTDTRSELSNSSPLATSSNKNEFLYFELNDDTGDVIALKISNNNNKKNTVSLCDEEGIVSHLNSVCESKSSLESQKSLKSQQKNGVKSNTMTYSDISCNIKNANSSYAFPNIICLDSDDDITHVSTTTKPRSKLTSKKGIDSESRSKTFGKCSLTPSHLLSAPTLTKKVKVNKEIEAVVEDLVAFVCRQEEISDIPVRMEHYEERYSTKNYQTEPLCGKEYCTMGCVCYCIRRKFKRKRCDNHQCIFGCVCFKLLKPRRHSSTDTIEQIALKRKSYSFESKNFEVKYGSENSDFIHEKCVIPPKHSRRQQSLPNSKDTSPLDRVVLKPSSTKNGMAAKPITTHSSVPNQYVQMVRQSWKPKSIFKKKKFRSNSLGLHQLSKSNMAFPKHHLTAEEHTPKVPVQSCPPTQNVAMIDGPPPAFALTCMTPGIGYIALHEFGSSILRLSDPFEPTSSRTFTTVSSTISWLNNRLMECLKLDQGVELKWVVANSVMIQRKKIKCFDRNVLLDSRCRITKNGVLFI